MARIANINITEDNQFSFILDDGTEVSLPSHMAGIIKERMLLQEVRYAITNILDDEINDGNIDMSKHEFSREDFEEEIYCDFEDDISCGDYSALSNDGDWIRERIIDVASYYGLEPDDEDEDEEED